MLNARINFIQKEKKRKKPSSSLPRQHTGNHALSHTASPLFQQIFLLAIVVFAAQPATALPNGVDPVAGLWYTQDHEGVIEIYPCLGKICGRFYWLKEETDANEQPSRDDNNPDPALRTTPLCGLLFMGGFTPDTDQHYTNGWIYSPHSGATYTARLTLVDHNTLLLHGYVLTPFLGETQTWKRATNAPNCAPQRN